MFASKSNVVVLSDFRKPSPFSSLTDVQAFLEEERAELRQFDQRIYQYFKGKHTLRQAETCEDIALTHEQELQAASDWLEDEIAKSEGDEKISLEQLLVACKKLTERNGRIKKNITDDQAKCRHYENKRDIFKLVGFSLVTPLTVYNLTKAYFPGHENLALVVGIGSAIGGTCLVFPEQTQKAFALAKNVTMATSRKVARHLDVIAKPARRSFLATALRLSVAARNTSEITPSIRANEIYPPKIAYSANKL